MRTEKNSGNRQQQALEELRSMILRGDLSHGEIHSEAEVAGRLAMSRTPVRTALAILAKEGIIETIPQIGFRIRVLSQEEIEEIFALRAAMETVVLTGLSNKVSRSGHSSALLQPLVDNIRECERRALETKENREDDFRFLEAAHEFHVLMAQIAGYHQAAELFQTFRQKLRLVGTHVVKPKGNKQEVIQEHTAILAAIQDGDEVKAKDLMLRHLHVSDNRFQRVVSSFPNQEGGH